MESEVYPSHPSYPSDSSGQAIASDSQWLPGVSCSGATTAWSLAKEVIKQLSFSYCLWVSLLSRPQASLSMPTLFPLALVPCVSGFHLPASLQALKEPHYFESLPALVLFPHDNDLQFAGLMNVKPLFRPKKFTRD